MKFEFDSQHNPKPLTLVLARKDGTKLSALPAQHVNLKAEFNSFWELNFSVYQNEKEIPHDIWNEIVDFKLLWVKELDLWFEIYVQTGNGNVCVKHITAKSLAQAELSQVNIYGVEINTEADIMRDDYAPTTFYNEEDKSHSLLHRILSKAAHYKIFGVSAPLCDIQRTFSFDGVSIYDALNEISEEIRCYFDFSVHSDEKGRPKRALAVYDLYSYCPVCNERGNFYKSCAKCGSKEIVRAFGKDTGIFVSTQNLTDEVVFETNEDSVKNCFKLESGDDLMDATIINCNPNGSSYLWYIPEYLKKEMPKALVKKLTDYDELFEYYQEKHNILLDSNLVSNYNSLVSKYLTYNPKMLNIPASIVGFSALMNEYYNTIDFKLLLQSALMPSVEMIPTTAAAEAAKLTTEALSPVAVHSLTSSSHSTVDGAVLAMAKAMVDYRYQVKIASSVYSDGVWTGSFSVTNYYNEEDSENSAVVEIKITDDYESYVSQMLDRTLSDTTNSETDIVGIFELPDEEFKAEIAKYSLAGLNTFYQSCEACLNILIEQGAADKETWESSDGNLYDNLYAPYRKKQDFIQAEISLREAEIAAIESVQEEIIANRSLIQNTLDFENYVGTDLWLTFIAYRREDTYSNSNYISEGLDNTELFERAKEYIETAKKELYNSANLQHSLSATLKNFLVMREFDGLTDDFELGNFIHVQCDKKIYNVRLLSFEIDYDNLDELPVSFSDAREKASRMEDAKDILDSAKSIAASYDGVARQAAQGSDGKKQLDSWTAKGLALADTKIIDNAKRQDYVFDEHGMLFRKYLPFSESYADEQLKIINSTIAITNDNWKSVKTAIGGYYYADPITKEIRYAYGVNGEVLIGKIILGEKLGIYNSEATMRFDKDGLYITNGMNTLALNPNAQEKLLWVKSGDTDIFTVSSTELFIKGKIIATSGYIGGENGWTIQSECFYNGKPSLLDKTEGVYIGTDGLSFGNEDVYIRLGRDGKLYAKGVEISGNITATSGDMGGCTIIDGALAINAENITEGIIAVERIPELSADKITAGTIDASKIKIQNLSADGIISGTLDAAKVNIKNITADSITSGTIDASKIKISNLVSLDSNDGEITLDGKVGLYSKNAGQNSGGSLELSSLISTFGGNKIEITATEDLILKGSSIKFNNTVIDDFALKADLEATENSLLERIEKIEENMKTLMGEE